MILIVDNFDSFVHNLARYIRQLGQATCILRNNDPRLEDIQSLGAKAIVIAPGPMTPSKAGQCLQLIERYRESLPLIGVCLGHQAIVESFGGKTVLARQPMHGRTSQVTHNNHAMFLGIESPFQVCRYHSLVTDPLTFPTALETTAVVESAEIMAYAHRTLPVYGVQFHPEAILTQQGYLLLRNLLQLCGLAVGPVPSEELITDHEFAGESI